MLFLERVMARLDYWHTTLPAIGSRKLAVQLQSEGLPVGRKLVRRLMQEMGLRAVYPKPNMSKRNFQEGIVPYLLRNKEVSFPNQVWSIDITYIKLNRGHMYLTAIIDWFSRKIMGWELSDTLDTRSVLETVKNAVERYGTPAILNSDYAEEKTMPENLITSCILIIRIQFFGIVFRVSQARRLLSLYQRSSTAFRHRQLWEQTC